jgi:hypothetical protein
VEARLSSSSRLKGGIFEASSQAELSRNGLDSSVSRRVTMNSDQFL